MRVGLMVGILALTALAGCAETPIVTESGETSFEDVQVEATDTTGVILGVVVDTSIVPISGATVSLTSGDAPATATDDQGRFVFSGLQPGTYFLTASHPLHDSSQFSADVIAGDPEPPVIKVQLTRKFAGDPYTQVFHDQGFFPCTQAGVPGYLYASSPCHSPAPGARLCEDLGVYCPEQARTFHNDVSNGWQSQVWEMVWQPTAYGTSEKMGIVVSTNKATRAGAHYFAEYEGASPLLGRLDCCEPHPTSNAAGGEPDTIPQEGWKDMSYFMSVRPSDDAVCAVWCVPPGLALEQEFDVYLTQSYYLPLPEQWSFLAGDQPPF